MSINRDSVHHITSFLAIEDMISLSMVSHGWRRNILSEQHMVFVKGIATEIWQRKKSRMNTDWLREMDWSPEKEIDWSQEKKTNVGKIVLSRAGDQSVKLETTKLIDFFVNLLFRKGWLSSVADHVVSEAIDKGEVVFNHLLNCIVDKIPDYKITSYGVMPRTMECRSKYYFYRLEKFWADGHRARVDYFTIAASANTDRVEACKFALILATNRYLQNADYDFVLAGSHQAAVTVAYIKMDKECLKFLLDLFPRTPEHQPDVRDWYPRGPNRLKNKGHNEANHDEAGSRKRARDQP